MLIHEQVDRVAGMAFPYAGRFMPLHGTTMSTTLVIFLILRQAGRISSFLPPEGEARRAGWHPAPQNAKGFCHDRPRTT